MSDHLFNLSAATKARTHDLMAIEPPHLEDDFAQNTFSLEEMRKRLPKDVFVGMRNSIELSAPLASKHAEIVALTMKEWAIERGATHFVHWFQPLTGGTAGKHDSFINPSSVGKAVTALRGADLIRGEPDASSFPNGGLRGTHEARGYTVWDPSSPAFLVENVNGCYLAIPTCFVSWKGDALDHKTPLLRSIDALDRHARRVLALFGEDVTRVQTTCGPEQEYYFIDEEYYYRRPDLVNCGRTLIGAAPPKGQQLDDHYFGEIPARILACMLEVEKELYKLGIPVKTRHNEVAPSQYEVAPVFETSGIAADHQQLMMITLKSVARKHGLVCLLHEKPFAGINGSGKHVNWSIGTNSGRNLLDPGDKPHENLIFLVFCAAVVRAVYRHQDLLRSAVASAANDHRLGANEAPPAILSVFLGKALKGIFDQLINGDPLSSAKALDLFLGVTMLSLVPSHTGDRNRTSPFAFTGNKFEFRSVGSSQSIAFPNVVLNLAVAESLDYVANKLRDALKRAGDGNGAQFRTVVLDLIADMARESEAILFEGDNYATAWHEEAERRGLLNLRTTVDALTVMTSRKNVDLFDRYGVLSEEELHSRQEVALEQYEIALDIEGRTAESMARTRVLPAAAGYLHELLQTVLNASQANVEADGVHATAEELSKGITALRAAIEELKAALGHGSDDLFAEATRKRDEVIPAMNKVREACDHLEGLVPADRWTLPTYTEMLFVN
ncbi:MAG: glutamine synthetase III [Bacteroidota bacterium]|nr:glutamine synthetase III [Bacteroidota bacterium]MDE2957137.1 glutamine synthetase III [Bacteroidota bacterium]